MHRTHTTRARALLLLLRAHCSTIAGLLLPPRITTVLDSSPLLVSAETTTLNLCSCGKVLGRNVVRRIQRPSVDELST